MKNKKALNNFVVGFLIILILIIIMGIVFLYFLKTSSPPELPENENPANEDSGLETPSKNVSVVTSTGTNKSSSGGGGGGSSSSGSSGGSSGGGDTGTIIETPTGTWGARDLGDENVIGSTSESTLPVLPSIKLSIKKIFEMFKDLF